MTEHKFEAGDSVLTELRDMARSCCNNSYSPYSNFPIGATLVAMNGEYINGTNVENASYGLSMCAERNAIFQGVAKGLQQFKAIAIYSPMPQLIVPCGVCLQVMVEFMKPSADVFLFNDSDNYVKESISYFLPHPFSKEILLNR